MKPLNTIKQGCGKTDYEENTICGEDEELCDTCQTLLKQTEEIIEEIEKMWKHKKQTTDKILFMNKFKDELKSAIIGEEKK